VKIGLDLDGVVYPFVEVMQDYLSEQHQREFPYPTQWDLWEDWGLTRQEFYDEFETAVHSGVVFTKGQPVDGARVAIEQLVAEGHTIHVVTDRLISPEAQKRTVTWLAKHGIPHDTLTFSRDKTLLPVDVFIEDSPHHTKALLKEGTRVVVFDRPWNRKLMIGIWTNITRAMDWPQVVDSVKHFDAAPARIKARRERFEARQDELKDRLASLHAPAVAWDQINEHQRLLRDREQARVTAARQPIAPTITEPNLSSPPREKPGTLRGDLLRESLALIDGDRNATYGDPHQDFQRTAEMLTVLKRHKLLPDARFEAHEVAEIMNLVKLSRLQWSPGKRDHWADIAGYAGCGHEAYERTLGNAGS
jgi:uncharacterized HAD superfamily protein